MMNTTPSPLPLSASINNAIIRALIARTVTPDTHHRIDTYQNVDGQHVVTYQTAQLNPTEYRFEYSESYAILDHNFQFIY